MQTDDHVFSGLRHSLQMHRHQKAADVIAWELRRLIIQEGRPGDHLPAEKELVKQFEVSRPTLREGLRILESEGLIEIRRGLRGGAVVRAPAVDDLAFRFGILQMRGTYLNDLFLARKVIEPAAAGLAAEAAGRGESLEPLDKAIDSEAAAIAMKLDIDIVTAAFVEFHDAILKLGGNTTLSVVWALLDQLVAPYTRSSLASLTTLKDRLKAAQNSHAAHRALAEAIRSKNPERAERIMRRHLDAAQHATQSVIDGRVVDVFTDKPPSLPRLVTRPRSRYPETSSQRHEQP